MILPASYANGLAPRDGQPLYPELWRGCVGAWASCLGPTGLTLRDWSPLKKHATLTNMDAASDWLVSGGKHSLDFDGTNDFATFAATTFTGDFSWFSWIRFNSLSGSRVWCSSASGTTFIGTLSSSTSITVRSESFATASFTVPTLSTNVVYAIGLTRRAGSVRLFVNGVESSSGATAVSGNFVFDNIGYQSNPSLGLAAQMLDFMMFDNSQADIRLLSLRPGIAYELAPRRRSSAAVQFNRRRRLLIGASS
jgi:hypothetical protein